METYSSHPHPANLTERIEGLIGRWDYANRAIRDTKVHLLASPSTTLDGSALETFGRLSEVNSKCYAFASSSEATGAIALAIAAVKSRNLSTRIAAGLGAVSLLGQSFRHGVFALISSYDARIAVSHQQISREDLLEYRGSQTTDNSLISQSIHIQR